jgi:hypothetical protein
MVTRSASLALDLAELPELGVDIGELPAERLMMVCLERPLRPHPLASRGFGGSCRSRTEHRFAMTRDAGKKRSIFLLESEASRVARAVAF